MMANQSMIRIEEREDQLRRISMFFNIDFSDRLNNQRNCNGNRRHPGGGVGIVNQSSTSIGEPNKFYSNCNYNNEIIRNTVTKCRDQHSRYHHRPMEHRNGRDNIDQSNRQFRPQRNRKIPTHLQERPVDISDFEYDMKNYGMERSCRKPHYCTDSKENIREPELLPRPSYRSIGDIRRAYSKHKPYPRSESHYEYCKHMPQPLKGPPPIPEPVFVPNDYNSHCGTPQRGYKYSTRQYAHSEPTSIHPRLARNRHRQASGSMACEYPPLYGHGSYESDIRQDYAQYTPDNKYKIHANKRANHENSQNHEYTPDYRYKTHANKRANHENSRYAKYDYYDQRPIDYDYYDTPRNRLSSVFPRDHYCYEETQSSISPGSIPNEYDVYTHRNAALKPARKSKYEYKEKRPKPPKSTFATEYRSNYQTPSYSKNHHEKAYRTEKNFISRKSVDFRDVAGIDGDSEIPHRILKQSPTVFLNKRNHFCTDKIEGHTGVRFSGVDIPYKQKETRNSFAARCDSQPVKRHDSGCDYRSNVNRVSVACQRSCRCQASQACLRPNYRYIYEPRRPHRRSLKQRISGFLRKSKICLKRTKRRAFGSKRYLSNRQSQCCACGKGSSPKLRSCLDTMKRSASRLTVRNKWYCKPKNDCPCALRSRTETSVKSNAFRQHTYPTVYREKSTCGIANRENYHKYSMLNCERACPTGRSRFPTSRCCIPKCSNDDCPSACISFCSKVNNLRYQESHETCACDSLISIENNECCRCQSNESSPTPSNINVCLTIRTEDDNLLEPPNVITSCQCEDDHNGFDPGPCIVSSRTECRIIEYPANNRMCAGSPSLDTLRCPKNNFENVRSALKVSFSPSQSQCSCSLSGQSGSGASIISKPRLICPQYSFSSMSNDSNRSNLIFLQPHPCKPSRPSLVLRDPNDMTPRPSKRVSLNTNCRILLEEAACGAQSSKDSFVDKPTVCKKSLQKRSCSEMSTNSNGSSRICVDPKLSATVFQPQMTAFNGNVINCSPRKSGSTTSISSGKNSLAIRKSSSNNSLKKTASGCCQCATKNNAQEKAIAPCQKNTDPKCSTKDNQKLPTVCCNPECPSQVTEMEANGCPQRSAIEELKKELLVKLQGNQGPGLMPTPQVMFLPCVPDAFCQMNGVVDNPFGKSYTKSIMCWRQYSQLPRPT